MNLKTSCQFVSDRVGCRHDHKFRKTVSFKFAAISAFLLLFLLTSILGVAQQRNWLFNTTMLNFSGTLNSEIPPTKTRHFATDRNIAANSASDNNGKLLFYVRAENIYDANHVKVGELLADDGANLGAKSEIAIVPFTEPSNCVKRYYIFYNHYSSTHIWSVKLKVAAVNLITGDVIVTEPLLSTVTSETVLGYAASGLAVGTLKNGVRHLYIVGPTKVQKIVISAASFPNLGIASPTDLGVPATDHIFHTKQAVLSNDGTKLAWAAINQSISSSWLFRSQYHVIDLDHKGNWARTEKIYHYTMSSNNTGSKYHPAGAAFNKEGTKLYGTTGITFSGNRLEEGVIVINLLTDSIKHIPLTNPYGMSLLALAYNGLLYAANDNKLLSIDTYTDNIVDSIVIDTANYHPAYVYPFIPDQIMGEVNEFFSELGDSIVIQSVKIWDGDSMGSTLRINKGGLTVKTGGELTIRNVTVEFADGAKLKLEEGTKLILENCTLKGMELSSCPGYNKMWKGIEAISTNSSQPIDIRTTPLNVGTVTIRDAEVGIVASGKDVDISLLRKTTFAANEVHINLINNAEIGNAEFNTFIGDEILRDQTKGDSNGYPDGLRRTKYGLFVLDADIDVGYAATFTGGQYGVYAASPTGGGVTLSTLTWQKRSGVFLTNMELPVHAINIANNWFGYTNNGVRIQKSNMTNFVITQNSFDNVAYNGVDISNTTNCKFYIGYQLGSTGDGDPGAKNTFTNSGAAAIYMHNNPGKSETRIYIGNNIITAAKPASHGIIVSENSGGQNKYLAFLIKKNTINNTERAIQLVNAVGANPRNPTKDRLIRYPLSQVTENTIVLHTNSGSNGIEASASSGHSLLKNSVSGNRYGRGANLTNSIATLYNENISNTGYGLMAQGHMYGSNYYCNQFDKANYGMYLYNHILRTSSGDVHGDSVTGARDNIFGTRPNSKPEYNICLDATNYIWNRWSFSTVWGIPAINSLTGGSTALFSSFEFNNCGEPLTPGGDPPPAKISELLGDNEIFWDRYTNQQHFKMGYDSIGSTDSNVVRLIDAEDYIAIGNFTAALGRINAIVVTPSAADELIMGDYKKLYSAYLAYRMLDTIGRTMNDSTVAILNEIALKNPVTQSPASHVAQAILYDERGLMFDHTPTPPLVLSGYLGSSCAFPAKDGIPVYLLNPGGEPVAGPVYTDTDGQFAFDASVVETYTGVLDAFKMRMILTDGTIVESMAASVEELAKFGKHEFDCLTATGPFIVSGQINPSTCPGEVTSSIITYLVKQTGEIIDGPLLAGPSGVFVFNPTITALHHNIYQYKIRLLFPDATMIEIPAETLADLAANSPYYFNCPETPPIFQGKKGNEKEQLKYRETPFEKADVSELRISPNPSNGIFNISGLAAGATATFTNLLGQVVAKDLPLLSGKVDASQLKAGIYFLTVSTKEKAYVQKVNIIK